MVIQPSSLAEAVKRDAPQDLELDRNKIIVALRESGKYSLQIGNQSFLIVSTNHK